MFSNSGCLLKSTFVIRMKTFSERLRKSWFRSFLKVAGEPCNLEPWQSPKENLKKQTSFFHVL